MSYEVDVLALHGRSIVALSIARGHAAFSALEEMGATHEDEDLLFLDTDDGGEAAVSIARNEGGLVLSFSFFIDVLTIRVAEAALVTAHAGQLLIIAPGENAPFAYTEGSPSEPAHWPASVSADACRLFATLRPHLADWDAFVRVLRSQNHTSVLTSLVDDQLRVARQSVADADFAMMCAYLAAVTRSPRSSYEMPPLSTLAFAYRSLAILDRARLLALEEPVLAQMRLACATT